MRDALIGIETGDIDLATPARPEAVIAALAAAKIKALPTGLEHGTVTAVVPPRAFRDHYAAPRCRDRRPARAWSPSTPAGTRTRRGAISRSTRSTSSPDGTLYDPVGGRADLAARRVRFVGDPATRIAEDVLRILRYYRFEARFGGGDGDAAARAACREAVGNCRRCRPSGCARELMRLLRRPTRSARSHDARRRRARRDPAEATRLDRLSGLGSNPTPPSPACGEGTQLGRSTSPQAGEGRGGSTRCSPRALIEVERAGAMP